MAGGPADKTVFMLISSFKRIRENGQTFVEYALVLALVLSAFLAMQVYVQRGLQARCRDASRYLIDQMRGKINPPRSEFPVVEVPYQYEPYYTNSEFTVNQESNMQENFFGRFEVNRISNEEIERQGNRILLPASEAD